MINAVECIAGRLSDLRLTTQPGCLLLFRRWTYLGITVSQLTSSGWTSYPAHKIDGGLVVASDGFTDLVLTSNALLIKVHMEDTNALFEKVLL